MLDSLFSSGWWTDERILWVFLLAKILLFFGVVFGVVAPVMIWVERRVAGLIQDRHGPNRVGPFGLLQSLADGIKLFFKEPLLPSQVNKPYFLLAPIFAVLPAATAFAVIPFGPPTTLGGFFETPQRLQIAELNVGILFVMAVTALSVYALVLAGWASNNKFSVLGSLRASAQMISYELAAGLAIVSVVLLSGSVDLVGIVESQKEMWHIFPGILAFIVFLPAIYAETNRTPFDLPEAEAELVVGYHTEYSGIKFGLFFLSEYAIMTTVSAMCVLFFFGGWEFLPGLNWDQIGIDVVESLFGTLLAVFWFCFKVSLFLFLFVWVRWTLPRFRYDQLMDLGWKTLLPIAIFNIVLTAGIIAFT
ncbi:MAG: NADH-quinone oxidoreductase subunit NuoH [Bradymonadales bacterium]|nr:MAG: NADH-quinone oxidoreductase subunit NuoH [Bradymonadales bacterium]